MWLLIGAVGLMLTAALSMPSQARGSRQGHSDHSASQELKVPQTAQEHRERAEYYQKKAAEYRQDAEAHKKMLADYSKGVARNPKETSENPYLKKMRLHCDKYVKAAEALATEADEMAKYHSMRAKELEGK